MRKIIQNHIKNDILANGYLLIGETDAGQLADFLKDHGEVYMFDGEIGIDKIRWIKEKSAQSLGQAKRAFFILDADKMNYYAFTAMLKTIEEASNRHFFVLSKNIEIVPETLRSRLVQIISPKKLETNDDLLMFIKADYSLRAKMIEKIAENKEKFGLFLDSIERKTLDENKHHLIPKIRRARESALIFNIGRKMCLEYLTHLL